MAAGEGEGGGDEAGGGVRTRFCETCGESVHDFVGREDEVVPGVCGRIGRGRPTSRVGRVAGAALAVAVFGGLVAAVASVAGDAVASNVPRDAGPSVDASVDADEPPLMGKLVFAADDQECS